MKIAYCAVDASAVETPLLVVLVADAGDKTAPAPELLSKNGALLALAAPRIAAAT